MIIRHTKEDNFLKILVIEKVSRYFMYNMERDTIVSLYNVVPKGADIIYNLIPLDDLTNDELCKLYQIANNLKDNPNFYHKSK